MKQRASMLVLFMTVFIDLIGFGIVMPLLPFFARRFAVSGFYVTLLMALFSLAQFVFAPFWGRLSDKIGRRPVLLISLAGSTLSYVALGFSHSYWQIFATRLLAGFFGGNIAVANAYIADITPPEKRSKGMGLIGAAFGLGFVLGPAITELIIHFANESAQTDQIYHLIGWVAGAICGLNFLIALFTLAESLPLAKRQQTADAKKTSLLASWRRAFSIETVPFLIIIYFVLSFAFANFESVFSLFIKSKFHYDIKEGNWFFLFLGLIVALVQGGLIGRLVKTFGESSLILYGGLLLAASLVFVPFANGVGLILVALTGLGLGQGVNRSSVMGLISQKIESHEQGAILGVAQSASSLARIVGPMVGGFLFDHHRSSPFIAAGAVVIVTLFAGSKFLFNEAT